MATGVSIAEEAAAAPEAAAAAAAPPPPTPLNPMLPTVDVEEAEVVALLIELAEEEAVASKGVLLDEALLVTVPPQADTEDEGDWEGVMEAVEVGKGVREAEVEGVADTDRLALTLMDPEGVSVGGGGKLPLPTLLTVGDTVRVTDTSVACALALPTPLATPLPVVVEEADWVELNVPRNTVPVLLTLLPLDPVAPEFSDPLLLALQEGEGDWLLAPLELLV